MKILHVIESLEVGGAEMLVVNLIREMPKEHQQAVCCIKRVGPLSKRLPENITIYCLDKKEGNSLRIPFRIATIIRNNEYDVIHCHNWGHLIESVIGGKMGGAKRLIHTAHGAMEHYSGNRMKRQFRKRLERYISRFAYKIVAVSDYLRDQIIADLSIAPERLVTIYNGVVRNEMTQRVVEKKNVITLITVGRLVPIKNYRMLVQAFAMAKRKCSFSIRLILVGDGSERDALEKLKNELKLNNSLIFYGFRDDVELILSESDIFVNSSRYEGISLAILEAMQSSIPVIATSVGGNKEIVSDGFSGFLVPDNNAEKFSDAIVSLATDLHKRRRFGENGRAIALEKYNFHNTINEYMNLYQI